ncbi:aldose 1-epimerase family protein [Devosia yakushimensis]|nr:aldose 1-epimerase family protein [Devosia yakushimensis]
MSQDLVDPNGPSLPNPQSLSRSALRERTVDGRGLADIRLLQLEDGPGRGQRLLVVRNATGIGCEIALDRGFDISSATWRGINIGWNSANGLPWPPHPIDAEHGVGFYRNLDGFLVTCGLDHIGGARKTGAEHFIHKHRREVFHPLHGRISSQRATLSGYGITWEQDVPTIWAEGMVRQSAVFGENLILRRRIQIEVFGTRVDIADTVENAGFRPTPHAMLYHLNFGYPFLDQNTRISGDISPDFTAAFNDGDKRPHPDFVDYYEGIAVQPNQAIATIELRNEALLGGMRARLSYPTAALPALGIWRAFQSGIYALALEPAKPQSPETNILAPGESVTYKIGIGIGSTTDPNQPFL